MEQATTTVDPAEVAKFQAMAEAWWDPEGKFKPLHMLNPCRLDYITRQIAAEFGRDCRSPCPLPGCGFWTSAAAAACCRNPWRGWAPRWWAPTRPSGTSRGAAACRTVGLAIDYRHTTAEALAAAGERFDVVLNMEVVEHVSDPLAYLTACHDLLKPGGLMVCSTLNRNAKSFAMAIVGPNG